MTMYATLEEAIDAAREEFLADNPALKKKMTCNNSISKNTFCQDGDIIWQAEFFADEGERRMFAVLSGEGAPGRL